MSSPAWPEIKYLIINSCKIKLHFNSKQVGEDTDLGMKEIGSIEEGKRADFVLINGDVQKDIKAIRNTETVFKNGVGFDSKKLFESVKGLVGLY